MKRFLCMCLVISMTGILLTACKQKEETPETHTDVSSVASSEPSQNPSSTPSYTTTDTSFVYDDRIQEDKELTKKGYPPLPLNLQILYQDAYEMVRCFTLCNFQTVDSLTEDIGGMTYLTISDPRFATYDQLVTYLQRFFTDDYIYNHLLTADSCVRKNSSGLACVIDAGGAENACYAGHVFTVEKHTADVIQLRATVYQTKDSYTGSFFYETPANPGEYTTETYPFTLRYTDKGWRFSEFAFLQG